MIFRSQHKYITLFCVTILSMYLSMANANVEATNTSQLKIIKAADELSFQSQMLVKNYFYLHHNFSRHMAGKEMADNIVAMENNINTISDSYKDAEIQGLIEFTRLIFDDLKATITNDFSEDNAFIALDMSDVILESAINIRSSISLEEGSLIDELEYLRFLLERIAKLYIATHSGFDDFNAKTQVDTAVADFEVKLQAITETHGESPAHAETLEELKSRWTTTKQFYVKLDETTMPRTVFYSTSIMGRKLNKLITHEINSQQ